MKKLFYIGAGITLLSAILIPGVSVRAQDAATSSAQLGTQQAPATTSTALSERIEKRKAAFKTKLTNAQQNRIKTRCKNAQGKLQSVSQQAVAVQQNREKSYNRALDIVTALQPKLAAANSNTSSLDAATTELKMAIESFKKSNTAYQDALKDTAALDCQADPVAFQASLADARTALQTVRADAGNIRTVINQKIKPALADIKLNITDMKAGQ